MKRFSLTLGTRAELTEELEQYRDDKIEHGKMDDARQLAAAITQIKNGTAEAYYRRGIYTVADIIEGTRAELTAALQEQRPAPIIHKREGLLAIELDAGIAALAGGAQMARVRGVVYCVTESATAD